MWLVKNNVPFDIAFGPDEAFRIAGTIVMSEFESGRSFNFSRWEFDEPTKSR